jgi:ACR3 family arsenite efflux pump ArsB
MTESRPITKNPFLPLIIAFILFTAVILIFSSALEKRNIDSGALTGGNILLFVVSMFSYLFYRKALLAGNTQEFLRHVYSAILMKLFVCAIAAFIYIYTAGKNVNTGAIFGMMFFYIVYTGIELSGALKQSRQIKENK